MRAEGDMSESRLGMRFIGKSPELMQAFKTLCECHRLNAGSRTQSVPNQDRKDILDQARQAFLEAVGREGLPNAD